MLERKTIVVTGAASGIGAETAKLAASQGAEVISVDIRSPAQPVGAFLQADLSDEESILRLVSQLPARIDGLANIAGLPPTHPAASVIKVNLVGLKQLTLALLPRLAAGASIVNLASLAAAGWVDNRELLQECQGLQLGDVDAFCRAYDMQGARSYFLSKEALVVWTMSNRWTWRDRGIRMNAISPGPVETPILHDFVQTLGTRAEQNRLAMDRSGRPEEIAPAVCFLLSDASSWIRGTNLPVDGGIHSGLLLRRHGFEGLPAQLEMSECE